MPTLYLMLGYPGAGKTTTSQAIQRLTGAVHLWADHVRTEMFAEPDHSYEESLKLYDRLNKEAARLLSEGQSVIFDTNFNFYKDRQKLRRIAARHGAETKLIWVQTPQALARERATGQARFPYDDIMPPERFERKVRNLQKPRPDENYIAVDGTRITDDYVRSLLTAAA